jgi:hypothetical protein
MLLSLALLGSAVVGGALELLAPTAGSAPGSWLSLALLAAGAGATLWAYASGPPRRGDESFAQRITPRGKLALGLVTASQVVSLPGGLALAAVEQLRASAGGSTSLLAVLGLILVTLGTGAAAATFRSRGAVLPGPGPLGQRLSPLARATCTLLGLALAVVGVASFLSPEGGMLLCLVLLTLGAATGLFALLFAAKAGARDEAGPAGIPSRGWVSLALLALAGAVLGAQEARLLGPLSGLAASDANRSRAGALVPVKPVGDEPSAWSQRRYAPGPAEPVGAGSDRARLERELGEARDRIAAIESALRSGRPPEGKAPARPGGDGPVVDVSDWRHRSDSQGGGGTVLAAGEKDRLERELADTRRKAADLEAALRTGRPAENTAGSTVDVSRWSHRSP